MAHRCELKRTHVNYSFKYACIDADDVETNNAQNADFYFIIIYIWVNDTVSIIYKIGNGI